MAKNPIMDDYQLGALDETPSTIASATLKFWQRSQKSHWHPVQGISMWPFLKQGDSVLLSPDTENLAVGDVVVVRFPRRILVHRIASVNGKTEVITWGDFNLHPDPVVMRSQIIGKVLEVERNRKAFPLGRGHKLWGCFIIWGRPLLIPAITLIRYFIRIRNRLQTFTVKSQK